MNAPEMSAAEPSVSHDGAKCVVVVEDDPDLRHLIVKAIGDRYTVYEASDGVEGIAVLHSLKHVDLVITDVMMPRLNGVHMARWLKSMPSTHKIPIVFLTAKDSVADVVDGINSGARQYLTKPFKVSELVERVQHILR